MRLASFFHARQESSILKQLSKPNSARLTDIRHSDTRTLSYQPENTARRIREDSGVITRHAHLFPVADTIHACILFPQHINAPESTITVDLANMILLESGQQNSSQYNAHQHNHDTPLTRPQVQLMLACLRRIATLSPEKIDSAAIQYLNTPFFEHPYILEQIETLFPLFDHCAEHDPHIWLKVGNALLIAHPEKATDCYQKALSEHSPYVVQTNAIAMLSTMIEQGNSTPLYTLCQQVEYATHFADIAQNTQQPQKYQTPLLDALFVANFPISPEQRLQLLLHRIEHGLPLQIGKQTNLLIDETTLACLAQPIVPWSALAHPDIIQSVPIPQYFAAVIGGYLAQPDFETRVRYLELTEKHYRVTQATAALTTAISHAEETAAQFFFYDCIRSGKLDFLLSVFPASHYMVDLIDTASGFIYPTESPKADNAFKLLARCGRTAPIPNSALQGELFNYLARQQNWGTLFDQADAHTALFEHFIIKGANSVETTLLLQHLSEQLSSPFKLAPSLPDVINQIQSHLMRSWVNQGKEAMPTVWSEQQVLNAAALFANQEHLNWLVAVGCTEWRPHEPLSPFLAHITHHTAKSVDHILQTLGHIQLMDPYKRNAYAMALMENHILGSKAQHVLRTVTAEESLTCLSCFDDLEQGDTVFKLSSACEQHYCTDCAVDTFANLTKGNRCQSGCECLVHSQSAVEMKADPAIIQRIRHAHVTEYFLQRDDWQKCGIDECVGGHPEIEILPTTAQARKNHGQLTTATNPQPLTSVCLLCHTEKSTKDKQDALAQLGNVKLLLDNLGKVTNAGINGAGTVRECLHCGVMAIKDKACAQVTCEKTRHQANSGCGNTFDFVGGDRPGVNNDAHHNYRQAAVPAQQYIPSQHSLLWQVGFYSKKSGCKPKQHNPQLIKKLIAGKKQWFERFEQETLRAAAKKAQANKDEKKQAATNPFQQLDTHRLTPSLATQTWWPHSSRKEQLRPGDRIHFFDAARWETGVIETLLSDGLITVNPSNKALKDYINTHKDNIAPYGAVAVLPDTLRIGDWIEVDIDNAAQHAIPLTHNPLQRLYSTVTELASPSLNLHASPNIDLESGARIILLSGTWVTAKITALDDTSITVKINSSDKTQRIARHTIRIAALGTRQQRAAHKPASTRQKR